MTIFRHMYALALLCPAVANGQSFQSHDRIDSQVTAALVGTTYRARPVDRRLKLASCLVPITTDLSNSNGVMVHCANPVWRLRVLLDAPPVTMGSAALLIRRGDPVTVNFGAPGFSITTSGVAENEARAGERVRVRIEPKSNPVIGEAVDVGIVRVGTLN